MGCVSLITRSEFAVVRVGGGAWRVDVISTVYRPRLSYFEPWMALECERCHQSGLQGALERVLQARNVGFMSRLTSYCQTVDCVVVRECPRMKVLRHSCIRM